MAAAAVYSADRHWRADIDANTYNFWFSKKIGATATVQHREWTLICFGPACPFGAWAWRWVSRPAASIRVSNSYTAYPPQPGPCNPGDPAQCAPAVASRACT